MRYRRRLCAFPIVLALLGSPLDAFAQWENIYLPVDTIERLLRYEDFEIASFRDARFEGDRTQHAVLRFPGKVAMRVKWAAAPKRGDSFNNRPRFELAAYELQKLFLDEDDYVVPPTVARAIPLEDYPRTRSVDPTFDTSSVLVLMQYWLSNVTPDGIYDRDRLNSDSVYARHFGNLNILTYLIRHADANFGNFLLSTEPTNPRLFAVDNGVSFGDISDRPDDWRRLRTDRLPRAAVERLRGITEEDLQQALGVMIQYEIREGRLVEVEPTENRNPGRGAHKQDDVVQMGLTSREIRGVYGRLEDLLRDVDRGRIEVF
ncbi:MAG: hypothetical protein JSV86_14670 [Gemmatimonadota bacterium]|nr:MAG: hypothetical protein JSV86_14670 [Gemmatimonadota bacterium]